MAKNQPRASRSKDSATQSKTTWRTLHYYWQASLQHKWYAIGTILVTPAVIFVRVILAPLIFADLIEKVSLGLTAEEIIATALWEVLAFLGLYIFSKFVLEELRLFWCWKFELLVMYDLATLSFNAVSAQSMQFHSDRFSGSLVSQVNKFVYAFERLFDVIIWNFLPLVSYVILVVIVLWPQAPWFTIGLVALVIVYALISGLSFRKISHLNDAEAQAQTRQTGQLADSISNIISVKSYAREAHERHRFANFSRKSYHAGESLMRASIRRDLLFSVVQISMTALLLAFLIYGRTWLGISIATLVLIVNYSQSIMGELWDINNIFKNTNRALGDAHEMTIILDTRDDVVDAPNARTLLLNRATIDFQQISFQHQDAKEPIFTNFSLHIRPGERVGLVGVSGSGKTTLTKLLLRFADVTQGAVLISGQDIKTVTQQSLRECIAYVPQETTLFHRSVAENIAYAKPDATPDEITHAAKLANADEFIRELPNGYDTLVGERGIKLSGGQRQRIAIARAILKNAPILVLDEATSALDSESEALIQDALLTLMRDRTSVVIAHRLSTVASLDRIVVLQDGKIVEQGTHSELLSRPNGVYHHLWARQSGAFMEE